MLRYKEKEDIEARFTEVDGVVSRWRERESRVSQQLRDEFRNKLLISLIFHDAALEGEVLSHSEIKAAIDTNIISDASLIPSYEEIKGFHAACQHAFDTVSKGKPVKLDILRELYCFLDPKAPQPLSYRKDNPLHRLYYHEITPPDKIQYRMRKYGEWLDNYDANSEHPIRIAAEAHFRLMAVFPWAKQSGRIARLVANIVLEHAKYPLAVIHSIDRQRYYESLRSGETEQLLSVYLEAVQTAAASALRVYDEAEQKAARNRRAS